MIFKIPIRKRTRDFTNHNPDLDANQRPKNIPKKSQSTIRIHNTTCNSEDAGLHRRGLTKDTEPWTVNILKCILFSELQYWRMKIGNIGINKSLNNILKAERQAMTTLL